jgi:drug/metabolite transporter (DMT)-like permease
MSKRGWLLFAAMSLIWGIPYLLIKVADEELTPATVVFLRTGIAALLLVPIAARRDLLRPLLVKWQWIVIYTVVEIAGPWLLLTHAETRLSSSLSGLLIAAVPLIGAIVLAGLGTAGQAGDRHDDRLDAKRLLGLLVGLGGVGVLVGVDVSGSDAWAVVEIAVTAVGYALGPIIIARKLTDLPTLGVVAASLGLTAVARERPGRLVSRWPGACLHRARVHRVLRAHRRSRPGQGDGDHLRQPGGGARARRAAARRGLHGRHRDRLPADLARLLLRDRPQPPPARRGGRA